jgi:hypothetical protein
MPRGLSAGQITALQTEPFVEEHLIEIVSLTTAPIYLTTNPHTSTAATAASTGTSQTFLSSKVSVIGAVTDTLDGGMSTLQISLATSTAADLTTFLTPDGSSSKYWFNAEVYLSIVFRNPSTMAIVDTPILLFKGKISELSSNSGLSNSGFTFTVQSEFADFNKALKQDPIWQYTKNAKETYSNMALDLGSTFGYVG